MKANKFFAVAMAALALVACKPGETGGNDNPGGNNGQDPDKPGQEVDLVLNPTKLEVEIGATGKIEATTAVAEFKASSEGIVELTPAADAKSVEVKGVAAGNVIITATTKGGQNKTCIVTVKAAGSGEGGGNTQSAVKGSKVWPLYMDGTSLEAIKDKVVADFTVDDVDKFIWNWVIEGTSINTYTDGSASGLNFHGNNDGYLAWTVGTGGWAGGGFQVDGEYKQKAEELRKAIVANPDKMYLHFAMKSTDTKGHCFYLFGAEATTKFGVGPAVYGATKIVGDFTRDGSWGEFDIPMTEFAAGLATPLNTNEAIYIFSFLTDGAAGTQFNLDAVYFYEK